MKRKKSIKKRNIFVLGIIIMVLSVSIVYATNYLFHSSDVRYSNTSVASKNVQDAINEIYTAKNEGCYVGYTKGTETSTAYLCNKSSNGANQTFVFDSSDVTFDNSETDLTSTNVKDALDEIVGKLSYCKDNYTKQNQTSNSYECRINTLPSTLTVANNNIDLTYGGSNGENAYSYNGDGTVSCQSNDTTKVTCSVDSVNHKIIVTPVAATSSAVTITVSATVTANYLAPSDATFSVSVAKATGYITLSANSGSVDCSRTSTFTVSSHHGGTLSCSSNDDTIATCSVSGTTITVNGIAEGNSTLTVTSGATSSHNSASATYTTTTGSCGCYEFGCHYSNLATCASSCPSGGRCFFVQTGPDGEGYASCVSRN